MTDWYKRLSGHTRKQDFGRGSYKHTIEEIWKQSDSKYPLRELGIASEGESFSITEEERIAHMHIIGTTGMGKSYFLLKLMAEDIDRGNGFCFLDPSFTGNTMKMVLAHCARVGFNKVLLVDPHYRKKVTPLNLFYKYKPAAIENVYSLIRVLFDMKQQARFTFIEHYMPAFLGVLWNADLTLYESIYFSEYGAHRNQRERIFR